MATYKATALFNFESNVNKESTNTRTGGWSESIYIVEDSFTKAAIKFRALLLLRAACLPHAASIIGMRFSDVDSRQSNTQKMTFPGSVTYRSGQPQQCLQVSLPAQGTANSRAYAMRCLPSFVVHDGEYVPDGTHNVRVAAWFAGLGNFKMRAIDKTVVPKSITSISSTGAVLMTQALAGVTVGSYLRVTKAQDAFENFYSGRFQVKERTSDSAFVLKGWKGPDVTGGAAKLEVIIYPNIDPINCAIVQTVTRKIGRPFGGYRGKASAKR